MKNVLVLLIGTYLNVLSYFSKSYAAHKALYLFAKPRKGKISEIQGDFLNTAFKETLAYQDNDIMTYHWLGTKQTIMLVHGWESNAARWKPIIINLRVKGFVVVALDAPAHGNSGSNNFNALLFSEFIHVVAKRFKPEIIIGHSVGGMAAVFCQEKYQLGHLKKLVLLGAPSEFADILERYTNMLGYNRRIKVELNAIILERYGKLPEAFSTAKYLKNIDTEGLIIHDEHDPVIPYSDARLIKNSYKNSTLISTNGLGHSLNNEIIASHIYEFIDG